MLKISGTSLIVNIITAYLSYYALCFLPGHSCSAKAYHHSIFYPESGKTTRLQAYFLLTPLWHIS